MSAEQIFAICNATALTGWLALIIAGRTAWASKLVSGTILPLLLGLLYTGLILGYWGKAEGGFGTLAQVQALFSNQWLLLAGWVHYLAFDLFIGSWQVREAQRHGISHLIVVPGLILTFLFGPIGLLLFYAVRSVKTRQWILT